MTTQWHPLFARLLRLLLESFYQVENDVPVSDLPREGDLVLIRRASDAEPPFTGLWSFLTEVNVLEFKGPTDSPEEADLELLIHVGTGITYRLNEERRKQGQQPFGNHQVSFWYVAPTLGETFLGHARSRTALDYEPGGLWRGRVWGHRVYLVGYRDTPVEPDTVPLHFLAPAPAMPPHALAELLAARPDLLSLYEQWLFSLHPSLWQEVRNMTQTPSTGPAVDWKIVAPFVDVKALVDALGEERVTEILGVDRVVGALGIDRVIGAIGVQRVIDALGAEQVVNALGQDRLLEILLNRMTPEQQHALRERLPGE
jgi:hypothetical protein